MELLLAILAAVAVCWVLFGWTSDAGGKPLTEDQLREARELFRKQPRH